MQQRARAKVEALVEEGLNSGVPTEWTPRDWENIRQEIQEGHAKRNRQEGATLTRRAGNAILNGIPVRIEPFSRL